MEERPDVNYSQAVFDVLAATKLTLESNTIHTKYLDMQEIDAMAEMCQGALRPLQKLL